MSHATPAAMLVAMMVRVDDDGNADADRQIRGSSRGVKDLETGG